MMTIFISSRGLTADKHGREIRDDKNTCFHGKICRSGVVRVRGVKWEQKLKQSTSGFRVRVSLARARAFPSPSSRNVVI